MPDSRAGGLDAVRVGPAAAWAGVAGTRHPGPTSTTCHSGWVDSHSSTLYTIEG